MAERSASGEQTTWHDIDQALQRALEQNEENRENWVHATYADQPEVRDAVLALLADDLPSAELLGAAERERDRLSLDAGLEYPEQAQAGALVGSRIGPYQLTELVAVGGMGAVYRAHREDGQFKQTVAIKVLPAWAGDAQTVARLRAERQILSSLQHPNITRLLDGGETPDGFPYLVTEFIEGEDIAAWVQHQQPALAPLLQLIIRVCEAVQFAHQNLIIHRDIKPANILVDDQGRPHLLDFGIAKLLTGAGLGVTRPRTATGFSPMTPEYGSPEQRAGQTVTTASDIYQLGLLMYRLLTGSRPDQNPSGGVTRPSTMVRNTNNVSLPVKGSRLGQPARQIKGDLDTIVLKALREDPLERYASAGEMAADLRRFLSGEAIEARPESLWLASRRLARHYPLATGLALTLVGVLLASGVSLYLYALELTAQRDLAAREAQRANQVRDVLVDLFRRSDPLQADTIGGKSASVWDSLDAAADEAREELAGQPDILAELLATLATLYRHAGQPAESMALISESTDLYLALGPAYAADVAVNEAEFANILSADDYSAAETHLNSAMALVPTFAAQEPQMAATVWLEAAHINRSAGNARQALEYYHQAGAALAQSNEENWSMIIEVLFGQASTLLRLDDPEQAEPLLREALVLGEEHFGHDHSRLNGILSALSELERMRGNVHAAVAWSERMVANMEQNNATTYDGLLSAKNNLSLSYSAAGRDKDAQDMLREVVRIRRIMAGPEGNAGLAVSLKNLASSLHNSGDYAEVLPLLEEAQALMHRHLPETSPYRATPHFTRALVYLDTDRAALAVPEAEYTLAILEPALGDAHYQVQVTRCVMAEAMLQLGMVVEARALAESALDGILASGNAPVKYERRCQATVNTLAESP